MNRLSILLLIATSVKAHLVFSDPSVYTGGDPLYELEWPLVSSTPLDQWYCAGRPRPDESVPSLELVPGSTIEVPIVCGEAPVGADQQTATAMCDNDRNALHGAEEGGCALSIKIGDQDFRMLTVAHECPKSDWSSVTFKIPAGLPDVGEAECAWTWRPPVMYAQPESYMNCFKCRIVSNVQGTISGGTRLVPNPDFVYRKRYPDGPFNDLVVNAEPTSTPDPTETPTPTPTNAPRSPEDPEETVTETVMETITVTETLSCTPRALPTTTITMTTSTTERVQPTDVDCA